MYSILQQYSLWEVSFSDVSIGTFSLSVGEHPQAVEGERVIELNVAGLQGLVKAHFAIDIKLFPDLEGHMELTLNQVHLITAALLPSLITAALLLYNRCSSLFSYNRCSSLVTAALRFSLVTSALLSSLVTVALTCIKAQELHNSLTSTLTSSPILLFL